MMREQWQMRTEREQAVLIVSLIVLIGILSFAFLYEPLQAELQRTRQTVRSDTETVRWMKEAQSQLAALRQNGADPRSKARTPSSSDIQSLPTIIERSTRDTELEQSLSELTPFERNHLDVRFAQVGFDQLIVWLGELARQYRIEVVDAVIEPVDAGDRLRADSMGVVDARIRLARVDQ